MQWQNNSQTWTKICLIQDEHQFTEQTIRMNSNDYVMKHSIKCFSGLTLQCYRQGKLFFISR